MILLSKNTKLSNEKIRQKAVGFFKEKYGLSTESAGDCCIDFIGGGGHVHLNIFNGEDGIKVEIEAKEWEEQAKKFLSLL